MQKIKWNKLVRMASFNASGCDDVNGEVVKICFRAKKGLFREMFRAMLWVVRENFGIGRSKLC